MYPSWHTLKQQPGILRLTFVMSALMLLALPWLIGASMGNTWVRILDFALLSIMLALGLNIVVGFAGLLDLGYIAFYAVGAYLYALMASPHFDIHLSFWLVAPLAASLACLAGILLGTPTLKLRGDYLAIVTLGFGEIIRIFMNNLNAPVNITNGPQGINLIDPVRIGSLTFNKTQLLSGIEVPTTYLHYYLFLLFAVLAIFISSRLQHSRLGRAWVALREDEIAAAAMGINTRNVKLMAFAIGASFGGVAGALFASFQGFISPESFGLMESVMILCMVVLGGMGHIAGVVLGAVLLSVLPEALRHAIVPAQQLLFGKTVIDPESLRMLLFALALILVMIFRPAGLWPSPQRQHELLPDNDDIEQQENESLFDLKHEKTPLR